MYLISLERKQTVIHPDIASQLASERNLDRLIDNQRFAAGGRNDKRRMRFVRALQALASTVHVAVAARRGRARKSIAHRGLTVRS